MSSPQPQCYFIIPDELAKHPEIKPSLIVLYGTIARLRSGKYTATYNTLADWSGLSIATVKRGIPKLISMGFLERTSDGICKSNAFVQLEKVSSVIPKPKKESIIRDTELVSSVIPESIIRDTFPDNPSILSTNISTSISTNIIKAKNSELIKSIESKDQISAQEIHQAFDYKPRNQSEIELLTRAIPKCIKRFEFELQPNLTLRSGRLDMENISLTPKQLIRLIKHFKELNLTVDDLQEALVILSDYIANNNKGQKYKDHAAAICNWVIGKMLQNRKIESDLQRSEIYLENASNGGKQ